MRLVSVVQALPRREVLTGMLFSGNSRSGRVCLRAARAGVARQPQQH